VEKLTKQDIRGPDVFISNMQKFSEWAYNRRKALMGVLVLIAAVALAWAGMGTYSAKQEDAAAETLFAAEKTLNKVDQSFEVPPAGTAKAQAQGKPIKDGKALAVPTGKIEVDYKDAIEQLKDVITRFPRTQTSVIAALDLARIYHSYNKPDDSISVLNGAVGVANHPATKGLVLQSLGLAYESKGDCTSAVNQWQKIIDDKTMGPFQANSLIKQALCYEKLNQKDKAIEIFGRFDAAEAERKQLLESLATKFHINLRMPLQMQPKDAVQAFEKEATKSHDVQRLEALLSDRDSVKAAKKYLLLLKQGQS
jgi:predicted negative regulator of RcsB-dependent stress response